MAAKIVDAFPGTKVNLVEGARGAFIVKADGREIWNKRAMNDEFPDEDKLVGAMRGHN